MLERKEILKEKLIELGEVSGRNPMEYFAGLFVLASKAAPRNQSEKRNWNTVNEIADAIEKDRPNDVVLGQLIELLNEPEIQCNITVWAEAYQLYLALIKVGDELLKMETTQLAANRKEMLAVVNGDKTSSQVLAVNNRRNNQL